MVKLLPSQWGVFSTHFHCIACGHTFRRNLERIYIGGPTLDRHKAWKKTAGGRSKIIIPQHITCSKCHAVDQLARMRYANVFYTQGDYLQAQAQYDMLEAWYKLASIAVKAPPIQEAKRALKRLLEQARAGGELSRAETGWTQNARNYLENVWPLNELPPRAIIESPPLGGFVRTRTWMKPR